MLNEFNIGFKGLKDGDHQFEFRIEETFFQSFDSDYGRQADIRCSVDLEKKSNMLTLSIDFDGSMTFDCDRCLDPCRVGVDGEHTLYYKFTIEEEKANDDVFFIGPQDTEIDISRPLYEYLVLSIPARRVHEDGECDQKVIDALEGYDDDSDQQEDTDPRWDALKKLK